MIYITWLPFASTTCFSSQGKSIVLRIFGRNVTSLVTLLDASMMHNFSLKHGLVHISGEILEPVHNLKQILNARLPTPL